MLMGLYFSRIWILRSTGVLLRVGTATPQGARNYCRIVRPTGVLCGIRSRDKEASCLRLDGFFLEILIDHMLQVFGNFEDRHKMLIDHDLFTGPRVARHTSFALLDLEASESPDLDISSGLQSVDDGGDETIHHGLCFHLRQPCGRRDDVYDICFGQAASRKIENWNLKIDNSPETEAPGVTEC